MHSGPTLSLRSKPRLRDDSSAPATAVKPEIKRLWLLSTADCWPGGPWRPYGIKALAQSRDVLPRFGSGWARTPPTVPGEAALTLGALGTGDLGGSDTDQAPLDPIIDIHTGDRTKNGSGSQFSFRVGPAWLSLLDVSYTRSFSLGIQEVFPSRWFSDSGLRPPLSVPPAAWEGAPPTGRWRQNREPLKASWLESLSLFRVLCRPKRGTADSAISKMQPFLKLPS